MCLITYATAAKTIQLLNNEQFFNSVLTNNGDGVGVMYASSKRLTISRFLTSTPSQTLRDLLAAMPKDMATMVGIHWRMRTHGEINLSQCHPYTVTPTIALMHNGILSQGNATDDTKSDTWHYINSVIRPALLADAELYNSQLFTEFLGKDIGANNRFLIMRADGKTHLINKSTGIENDGVWFSNTYAWEPSTVIPDYRQAAFNRSYIDYFGDYAPTPIGLDAFKRLISDANKNADANRRVDEIESLVIDYPHEAALLLSQLNKPTTRKGGLLGDIFTRRN